MTESKVGIGRVAKALNLCCFDKPGACTSRVMPRLGVPLYMLCHAANPEPRQDP